VGAGSCGLLAAMFVDSPSALKLSLAGIGFFSGIYHPAGLGWIACCVSKTSTGMAYNGMFGNVGLAMGPLLAGLVNWFFGIEAVYICLGILNFFGLIFLLRIHTDQCTVHEKKIIDQGEPSMKGFGVLLVCMMLGGIVYRGATVTMPALFELRGTGIVTALQHFFTNTTLSGNVVATALTSSLYLIGMLGQFAGGKAGERFDLRYSYLAFHLMTLPAAFFIGITMDMPLVLLATVHSFFLLGMQPVENTLVARLTPASLRSSAYGMKFVLTFGVGALAVKAVKAVEHVWGLAAVFPTLGIVSLALVMAIGVLIQLTPKMKSA